MVEEIGKAYAVNGVLSCLATAGVVITEAAGGKRGTFAAMVTAAEDCQEKRKGNG